jgi:hypothetical protein
MISMKSKRRGNVHVRYAVAIGHAKLIVAGVHHGAFQPAAGHRHLAGIDQRHAPVVGIVAVDFYRVLPHVECDVRHVQRVVRKIFLDDVALVTKADDEIIEAIVAVKFHDMPEDRAAAHLDHRLGTDVGFLA